MKKEQLEKKYYSTTNIELCKELLISMPTLIAWLIKFDIKLKGKGFGNRKIKKILE